MIPTVAEPEEHYKEFHFYENCVFCRHATKFWHAGTNNPVCKSCAKKHKVAELYNWSKHKKGDKVPQAEISNLEKAQQIAYQAQKDLAEAARLCGQGAEHYDISNQLETMSLELMVTESRIRHAIESEKRLDIG